MNEIKGRRCFLSGVKARREDRTGNFFFIFLSESPNLGTIIKKYIYSVYIILKYVNILFKGTQTAI